MYRLTCLWLLAALASPVALADDGDQAKQLYENGAVLYEEGAYEQAIIAFQKAYDLSGEMVLQYNIANCYERMGQWQAAADALDLYRVVAPSDERDRLLRRITSLEDRARVAAEQEAQLAKQAAPAPAPVEPAPILLQTTAAPVVQKRTNWPTIGAGLGAVAVGGGLALGGFFGSRSALEAEDQEAWASNRAMNNVGLALGSAGVVVTVIGAVVPIKTRVEGLSVSPTGTGMMVTLRR
jgi:tetratricopeptide (TPR) repeat protein